jgi:hypothetical protein
LPVTELESVGTVAVDVLTIDESAFRPPDAPWNVDELVEPVRLAANTTTEAVPAEAENSIPAALPDAVGAPDLTIDASEPEEKNVNRIGWLAGAAALLVAPLVYWISKTRMTRVRKQP